MKLTLNRLSNKFAKLLIRPSFYKSKAVVSLFFILFLAIVLNFSSCALFQIGSSFRQIQTAYDQIQEIENEVNGIAEGANAEHQQEIDQALAEIASAKKKCGISACACK